MKLAQSVSRRALLCILLAAVSASFARQPNGTKYLTLDSIIGPNRVDFDGSHAGGLQWTPATQQYLERRKGLMTRIDAADGTEQPDYNAEALQKSLEEEGLEESIARRISEGVHIFDKQRTRAIILHDKSCYYCDLTEPQLKKLSFEVSDKARRELSLSPAGKYVTFVRDNDLFTFDIAANKLQQRTRDGSETLLNGVLDWVYQEEVYGRGNFRAYWWRDDDAYLAFLQLDEHEVPIYSIPDESKIHPEVERQRYPLPGDPNPRVRLGVFTATGDAPIWIDLREYGDEDILIVRTGWSPDGRLMFQVQDRRQKWLDLNAADAKTGQVTRLLRETSPAWVNVLGEPTWLEDGSFLWVSERDGHAHLYHYERDGRLIRQITSGDWKVRELHGVDPTGGWVYFSGLTGAGIETQAYRVPLDGGDRQQLTEAGFSHHAEFSPNCRYFIDTYSNIQTPPRVALRDADGQLVRMISENPVDKLSEFRLGETEFLRIPARDGYMLDAMIIRPPDYDAKKSFAVWCPVYAGPDSPTVSNGWQGSGYLMNQLMAQRGCIIWTCDPRSAHGVSSSAAWQVYGDLGRQELADIEDGLRWLLAHERADPTRIGISGFSYGGYMTAYALTHSDMFAFGIAGAPVTDWRNYDSIYTERYMGLPADNPDGYDASSAVKAAKDLVGGLLLVHGAIDDNVHVSNTMQFCDALQRAGKPFELMIYPGNRHGIHRNSRHWHELRMRYALRRFGLSEEIPAD
jgi:dipeptidyl-peptidase 4